MRELVSGLCLFSQILTQQQRQVQHNQKVLYIHYMDIECIWYVARPVFIYYVFIYLFAVLNNCRSIPRIFGIVCVRKAFPIAPFTFL